MTRVVGGRVVHGAVIDGETRCAHYAGPDDVLAILFACCRRWYPCHACHDADASHGARVWAAGDGAEHALLCGRCGATSSIADYRASGACGACGGAFNEGCRRHHHLYFA
ncbi:CHY zinc finger protein [Microbacterium gilvum]|uniref:CHY zinc finger protein n=1 Tax=Microbacterium gilvum TaxID=1336204 RepID=A0ABP8ZQQ7_9MICO